MDESSLHLRLEKWQTLSPPTLVACHLHNGTLNLGPMTHFAISLYNHTIRAFVSNSQTCHLLIQRGKILFLRALTMLQGIAQDSC